MTCHGLRWRKNLQIGRSGSETATTARSPSATENERNRPFLLPSSFIKKYLKKKNLLLPLFSLQFRLSPLSGKPFTATQMSSSFSVSMSLRTELFNSVAHSNRLSFAPTRTFQYSKLFSALFFTFFFFFFPLDVWLLRNSLSFLFSWKGSKCEMNRRSFALKGIVASGVSVMGSSLAAQPAQGWFFFTYRAQF